MKKNSTKQATREAKIKRIYEYLYDVVTTNELDEAYIDDLLLIIQEYKSLANEIRPREPGEQVSIDTIRQHTIEYVREAVETLDEPYLMDLHDIAGDYRFAGMRQKAKREHNPTKPAPCLS